MNFNYEPFFCSATVKEQFYGELDRQSFKRIIAFNLSLVYTLFNNFYQKLMVRVHRSFISVNIVLKT